ncbi:Type 1 glutamine amidotransferase-like domain-containing protein [Shewanella donghaensis]|uniref:Type 1 glutamine amidotransferase-like domain-containing protein n=1 Tax=Shewanella donghaensis TaxID=238836 RepID=UPI0011841141|nr:Type 1 glutamine amidotransferase-like domain-containing protein [Shewanella donghaensis]
MKLALLSDGTSNASQQAIAAIVTSLSIAQQQAGVVYIASEPDAQREYFKPVATMFNSLGIESVTYIDLEADYDPASIDMLRSAGVIYLSGGDTYRFLYWLKQRGIDKLLYQLLTADCNRPAIIGVSAGAMIMTPSIDSAPLCGDSNNVQLDDTDGIGLISFHYVPHFEPHFEPHLVTDVEQPSALLPFNQYQQLKQQSLCMCSDNDAVVVINNQLIEFGSPTWIFG